MVDAIVPAVELLPDDADDNEASNYVFQIEEFESDSFNASNFFVKYKAVYGSLDQMYEELKQYRDELNKSLYVIINRHYKDFISITSKLDGVDSRVHQHMTIPLLEIIDEIKAIYTTLHSYTVQMRQKIRQKQNIQQQKRVLKGVHSSILHYKDAESHYKSVQVLSSRGDPQTQGQAQADSGGRKMKNLLLYAQYKALYSGTGVSGNGGLYSAAVPTKLTTLDCLVAVCRELEQCSVSLVNCAAALDGDIMGDLGNTKYTEVVVYQKNQLTIMMTQVLQMAKTKLAYCLSSHYDSAANHMEAAAAAGDQLGSDGGGAVRVMSRSIRDSITHCIRVLLALQSIANRGVPADGARGNITAIEQAVAEFVFEKSLKLLINTHNIDTLNFSSPSSSASAVNSSTVRHSYQGLPEIFSSISTFMEAFMSDLLDICSQYKYHDQAPDCCLVHDVVVNSVLLPVMHLCANVHNHKTADGVLATGSNIFNVAIPSIFHHCYAATAKFIGALDSVVLARGAAGTTSPMSISVHPKVLALNAQWNTSVYYQLRSKEVLSRVTGGCSVVNSFGFSSSLVLKSVYSIGAAPSAATPNNAQTTLSPEKLARLIELVEANLGGAGLKTPLLTAFLVELHTLVHEDVFIAVLSGEFIQLMSRLFGMLRVFVLDCLGYHSKDGQVELRFLKQIEASASGGSPPVLDMLVAPVVCNTVSLTVDAVGGSKPAGSDLYAHIAPELLHCSADILSCIRYTQRHFLPLLVSVHGPPVTVNEGKLAAYAGNLLELQCKKLSSAIPAIYDHILLGVLSDLRSALQAGIEAVPTRYRMTNKPAPTTCNAYIHSLLDKFMGVYKDFLSSSNSCLKYFDTADADSYQQLVRFVQNFIYYSSTIFVFYVQKSLKVVKELEGRLNKRNKQAPLSSHGSSGSNLAAAGGAGGRVKEPCVSDLDKIQCQYYYDAAGFIDKVFNLHLQYEREKFCADEATRSPAASSALSVADKVHLLTIAQGNECIAELYNEIKEFEKFV